MNNWEKYEQAARKGPFALTMKLALPLLALVAGLFIFGRACSYCGEAASVAQQELGPQALLKKYSWFKEVAQKLQAMQANVGAAEKQLVDSKQEWTEEKRTQVPRDVREGWLQQQAEIRGLKAAFNALASEYNAAVRKVNWRIMNTERLPESFTSYIDA